MRVREREKRCIGKIIERFLAVVLFEADLPLVHSNPYRNGGPYSGLRDEQGGGERQGRGFGAEDARP